MLKTFKQRLMARWAALLILVLLVLGTAGNSLLGIRRVAPGWWFAVLAVVALAYLVMDRTVFMPFLGEAALPPSVLKVSTPTEATIDVRVKAPRRATHVVYWASEPTADVFGSPQEAYNNFDNAGVVPVVDGTAVLALQCPGNYVVPMRRGSPLPKHVHYRAVYKEGILGRVQTQTIAC